jgi:hypothetical protein
LNGQRNPALRGASRSNEVLERYGTPVGANDLLNAAIDTTIAKSDLDDAGRQKLSAEFALFQGALGGFQFALSRPTTLREERAATAGSRSPSTRTPQGLHECARGCDDDALRPDRNDGSSSACRQDLWRPADPGIQRSTTSNGAPTLNSTGGLSGSPAATALPRHLEDNPLFTATVRR